MEREYNGTAWQPIDEHTGRLLVDDPKEINLNIRGIKVETSGGWIGFWIFLGLVMIAGVLAH